MFGPEECEAKLFPRTQPLVGDVVDEVYAPRIKTIPRLGFDHEVKTA